MALDLVGGYGLVEDGSVYFKGKKCSCNSESIIKSLQSVIEDLQNQNEDLKKELSQEIVNNIAEGGEITLKDDLKVDGELNLTKNTVLNLGGKELSAVGGTYGDAVAIKGGDVTISNGVIHAADNQQDSSATLYVNPTEPANITLDNVEVDGFHPVYLNGVVEGTVVTIKSGNFTCTGTNGEAVYVQKGGKVIIEDGYFENPNADTYKEFLINIKDAYRANKNVTDIIEIKGGTFVNWDPSNNKSEGEGTNYVPEGYKVETEEKDGKTLYKVVSA